MSKLSPKERALLDLARKGWGPSARLKRAVRAGVPARLHSEPTLGDGAPGPHDMTTPNRIASASAFVQGPRGIAAGLAVVGLCVFFGARQMAGDSDGASSSRGSALVVATPTAASNPVREAEPAAPIPSGSSPVAPPDSENAAPGSTPIEEGAPTSASPRSEKGTAVAARPAPATPKAADTLAEEVALVRAAQKSLRDGSPSEALRTLSTHASRFPSGALREERMTLQVLALCALGDLSKARSIRAELERLAPASSHLRRLACAAP